MTLIAQITDPHLRDDGQDPFHDQVQALRAAFDAIDGMDLRPDAILLTGDIIDRTAKTYKHAIALLREAPVPLLPMPGNHDRAAEFRLAFGGWADFHPNHLCFTARVGKVELIALDSNLPDGRVGIETEQLDWLEHALANAMVPVMLALHHPPFPTRVPHLERGGFKHQSELEAIVRDSAVCRIVAGHSHRSMQTIWAGIPASTAGAIGHGLSLSLAGRNKHTQLAMPPSFELHHIRDTSVVTHQIML